MGNQLKNCAGKGADFYKNNDLEAMAKKAADAKKTLDQGMKLADNVQKLANGEEVDLGDIVGGDEEGEAEEEEEGSGSEDEDGVKKPKKPKKKKPKTGAGKWISNANAGLSMANTLNKYADKDLSNLSMEDAQGAIKDAKAIKKAADKIEA
eukprot:CAMPEP_0170491240 /NCGR_PEP_ID=MMETSP0208-20121228/10661_1 /TAXON_ID=197538 /ORGANISM="Strombidium inclinatum, Strain S3" /LENGTH=150 /DNA_ID=CAMNT_0010766785 /DNA_START=24 /DNA_END=476 /DNA_ORIENTATION=+